MARDLSSTWILEIFAATLSVLSIGALVGVLIYADGRRVVDWHRMTLNTAISILSTASKMAATFVLGAAIAQSKWVFFARSPRSLLDFEALDNASRGLSGCLKLLLRGRTIAIFGVMAVLLSVAFDPALQALVQFKQEIDYTVNDATRAPYAERYSAGNRFEILSSDTSNPLAVFADADYALQAAVLYGLTQPLHSVKQQLLLTCPSGNCTWPAVSSLAVCGTCNDVSSLLQKTSTPDLSSIQFEYPESGEPTNYTRYQLPNQLWLDSTDGSAPSLLMTTYGTASPRNTLTFKNINTLLWSMTTLSIKDPTTLWPNNTIDSTECGLYYCVKEYTTSVVNGIVYEVENVLVNATRSAKSWQEEGAVTDDTTVTIGLYNNTNVNNYTLEFDTFKSALNRTDLMLGSGFNVSQTAVDAIGKFFESTFIMTNISADNTGNMNGFYVRFSDGRRQYNPSAIVPLFASADLNATFAAVAASMSNAIRIGADNETYTIGQNGVGVTRFKIRWQWIALPVIVVALSVVQLAVSIFTSKGTPLWKSSTLATLSRGKYVGDILGDTPTVHEMEAAAEAQPVHLFAHTVVQDAVHHEKGGATSSITEVTESPSTRLL